MKYVILTGAVVFGAVMFVLWLALSIVGVPCLYAADLVERLNDNAQDLVYRVFMSTARKKGSAT